MDFKLVFTVILNQPQTVHLFDYARGFEHTPLVAVKDRHLLPKVSGLMPPLCADCVDLAVAVHTADRLCKRMTDAPRRIQIILPVRCRDKFDDDKLKSLLSELLYWYTGDNWNFEFSPHNSLYRKSERQMTFLASEVVEIALWSGGLDALVGLHNRYVADPRKRYVLVGTGSNSHMFGVQHHLVTWLNKNVCQNRLELVPIPITFDNSDQIPKNPAVRSRGFVFLLIGAVCAFLEGQNSLFVYENGIGAINLPYTRGEAGLDHTKAVHPISLLMMKNLIQALFERNFTLHNPYLFVTKAQMCHHLIESKALDLVKDSISCDRKHRQEQKPVQCGHCSSCLLRRQALAAASILDKTLYVDQFRLDSGEPSLEDNVFLRLMNFQAETVRFALNQIDQWSAFSSAFPDVIEVVDNLPEMYPNTKSHIQQQLINLYLSHVSEWDSALDFWKSNIGQ